MRSTEIFNAKEIVRSKSLRTICFKTSGLSELLGNKVKTNDNIEKEKENIKSTAPHILLPSDMTTVHE